MNILNYFHFFSVFIHPKDSIMVSEQIMLFPPIELKLFFSHPLNNEITNNLLLTCGMLMERGKEFTLARST